MTLTVTTLLPLLLRLALIFLQKDTDSIEELILRDSVLKGFELVFLNSLILTLVVVFGLATFLAVLFDLEVFSVIKVSAIKVADLYSKRDPVEIYASDSEERLFYSERSLLSYLGFGR